MNEIKKHFWKGYYIWQDNRIGKEHHWYMQGAHGMGGLICFSSLKAAFKYVNELTAAIGIW